MKVAYITSQFPVPSETFAATDIRELRRRGVEVEVYGYRPNRPDHRQLLAQRGLVDLPVYNCGPARQLNGLLQALRRPLLLSGLLRWLVRHEWPRPAKLMRALLLVPAFFYVFARLRRSRPAVVHLFWGQYTGLLGWLLRRGKWQPHLSMFLGAHDLVARLNISADIAGRADSLFTHARANLPALREMGIDVERVTVVHRGVDTDWVEQAASEEAMSDRDSQPVRPDQPDRLDATSGQPAKEPGLIVAAGRLQPYKGFDDVLRVLALLQNRIPEARLEIYGDGPDLRRLKELASALGITESVKFCGHVAHGQVIRRIAAAPLFLFMSRHDGERLPNAVKEAMFCRCVCITTITPGIEELIDHGSTGYIVEQGDVPTAAQYAVTALSADTPQMPAAARHAILTRFSVRTAMQRYVERWNGGP